MVRQPDNPVSCLLEIHGAEELRSYVGNLQSVVQALKNGWLPATDDPGVPELLKTLRQHFDDAGLGGDDDFLLRFGLTVPGTQRGIIPPLKVLEDNRGGFSARRQREAEETVRRLQEALAIGRFLFSGLNRDTQQSILELTDKCERLPRTGDADLLQEFRRLDEVQAAELAAHALRCTDAQDQPLVDLGIRILQRLACISDNGLTEATCRALLARKVFWPPSLYRDAADAIACRLVDLIEKLPDELPLDHLLLALAWTRTETALRAFQGWSRHGPRWEKNLHVPPAEYLPSAGWCLDGAGNRRDLISSTCFRLRNPRASAEAGVLCRKTIEKRCPSCGGPQAVLFDFTKGMEDRLAEIWAEAPRRVVGCLHCCIFGAVFTRYHPDGRADWLSPIEPCEYPYRGGIRIKRCYRTLDPSPISPFANAQPFGLGDASTLGGIPMWLQDAEFPRCLDCGQFMEFLAQHDNGPLGEEGIYYAFFCAMCRVAGVTYQQT